MYIYKFRVSFDEIENFLRDIEIEVSDNFESFHNVLFKSLGLNGNELASFSICDAKWNKKQEITLVDMQDESESSTPEYDEDEEYATGLHLPKFEMKNSIIKDFITDPHQQIIYEYDFLNPRVFYIELLKILPQKEKVEYPLCVHSHGILPKFDDHLLLPDPGDDLFKDLLNDLDEEDLDELMEDRIWDDSPSEFDSF